MKFTGICLITHNDHALADFYTPCWVCTCNTD